jgi:hypothetical protein
MSPSPADQGFFTLAEVQEFLCANCRRLLHSASLYAKRKIRGKTWHQAVPEPEEVVQIVFEKYWSGSRRMRRTVFPETQVFLAIASVLSNLVTNSENRHNVSHSARANPASGVENSDVADDRMCSPADDSVNREDGERLLALLSGNELDHRVLEFILGTSEKTADEFMHAVRPRTIADELRVPRHEVYRSLERMRKVFETERSPVPRRLRTEIRPRRPHFVDRLLGNDAFLKERVEP